jgi:hypothetical protein
MIFKTAGNIWNLVFLANGNFCPFFKLFFPLQTGDLADKLLAWFHGFPRDNEENRQFYRRQLKVYQSLRWHKEWCKVALPLLSHNN